MFLDGVEVGKIGEEMGLKENSVYKLKNRVRSRLKDEIERLCRELEPNEVAL
jgi:DNA-directed RNA polymerase specialized sigma24 family protein